MFPSQSGCIAWRQDSAFASFASELLCSHTPMLKELFLGGCLFLVRVCLRRIHEDKTTIPYEVNEEHHDGIELGCVA